MSQGKFSLVTASWSCPPSRMELARLQFSAADRHKLRVIFNPPAGEAAWRILKFGGCVVCWENGPLISVYCVHLDTFD